MWSLLGEWVELKANVFIGNEIDFFFFSFFRCLLSSFCVRGASKYYWKCISPGSNSGRGKRKIECLSKDWSLREDFKKYHLAF